MNLPSILGPSVSNADITVKDDTLGFFQKEGVEVVLDGIKVGTGDIRDGRQQNSARLDGISGSDQSRIAGGQSTVPQTEQGSDFVFGDVFSGSRLSDLLVAAKETAKTHA